MSKKLNVNYPYKGVGSYCPLSSHNFADAVTGRLAGVADKYEEGIMDVSGYTPPYDEGCFPGGFLLITLTKESLPPVRFGIEFGQTDEAGKLVRSKFDAEAWTKEPEDPHAAGIQAANFDEAWRIVCMLGNYLRPQRVTLSYGC